MRRLVIGNWKMNLTLPDALVLAGQVKSFSPEFSGLNLVIAPSHPWLIPVREELGSLPPNLFLSAQSVSSYPHGAYTGDVSAEQLKGVVSHCLIGHSEQRKYHHLKSEDIQSQIRLVLDQDIVPVVCFGEPTKGKGQAVLGSIVGGLEQDLSQLEPDLIERCVFAYEPLWAIGTGDPATPEYIRTVVGTLKDWFRNHYTLEKPSVLYGGSVTAANAKELGTVNQIDGLLVGGASLHAKEFHEICARYGGLL